MKKNDILFSLKLKGNVTIITKLYTSSFPSNFCLNIFSHNLFRLSVIKIALPTNMIICLREALNHSPLYMCPLTLDVAYAVYMLCKTDLCLNVFLYVISPLT